MVSKIKWETAYASETAKFLEECRKKGRKILYVTGHGTDPGWCSIFYEEEK